MQHNKHNEKPIGYGMIFMPYTPSYPQKIAANEP